MMKGAPGAVLACLLVCLPISAAMAVADEGPLLVRVERAGPDDLTALLTAGIPVVAEMNGCLLVRGAEDHLQRLDALGYRSAILDDRAVESDYLLAGLRPDSDLESARALGTIVHHEENWILLRVDRGASIVGLAEARMFVTRIPHERLAPPRPAPAASSPSNRFEDASPPDPLVQKIVDQVSTTEIDQFWQDLTSIPPTGTRYSTHEGCVDAANYCFDAYAAWNIPADYQDWSTEHAPNVVATWEGAVRPDEVYIIEGHLDDLPSTPPAPGADDNASGSVTVLEAARVMNCYAFESTVKFLNVTGEEFGLYGSNHYADDAYARGENILGVINMDMNGWEGDGVPDPENLDLNYNGPSEWLGLLFAECAEKYNTGLVVDAFYCPSLSASDHYPFWQNGYHAICGITDNEGYCGHGGNYPHYHTSDDTIANCGDPSFFYSVVRASVATLAEMAQPFKITFGKTAFACESGLQVLVGDRDLDLDPGLQETIVVEVWSDTETTPEAVTLTERDLSSMIFEAVVPTTLEPPVGGDGVVSISPGDTVSARYVDDVDCDGSTGVAYVATSRIDCAEPLISNVTEENVTETSATITWTTDEDSSSTVKWGEVRPPSQTTTEPGMTGAHAVTLDGLQSCTVYYYSVQSEDVAGNLALDDNAGGYYHFETYGDFGSGPQPCHAGQVSIDAASYACADVLTFRVTDLDLNSDPLVAETATMEVTSSTEPTAEVVIVTETGANTSVFTGSIPLGTGDPVTDGVLQTSDGDVLTVTYLDGDDGTGQPATSFDTAAADCSAPSISNLRVTDVTDQRLTVRFDTDEPGDTVVEWGSTPSLGETVSSAALTTSHALTLNRLSTCESVYLRVSSTDVDGNTSVADLAGEPHQAHTWDIPGLYWRETFEGDVSDWSLTGEWEIGQPQGLGGSYGYPDPIGAYNHDTAIGNDLTGLGDHAGDYEHAVMENATGPSLDARTWTNTKLLLYRQLNVRTHDAASIGIVVRNQDHPIYISYGEQISQSEYSAVSFDVSNDVDGERSVSVRFGLQSDYRQPWGDDGIASGWNIDDVILKDGTLPDYDACGGCGVAPSFGGVAQATDNDACGATGVTVSWAPAVSWGTGAGGTYAVYRDTVPGFVPSAANLVQSGVVGTSFNDASAPTDVDLYYLVRAENDETCGTGPSNGGLTDGNIVYAHADETTSRPAPSEVTTLRIDMVNHAHVRLEWQATAGAVSYRIYRSDSPEPVTFAPLSETGELFYEDLNQGANANTFYYLVNGVNACGVEGP